MDFLKKTRSETNRFHQKCWVKLCVFGENAVFEKIHLFRGIPNVIYNFFLILGLGLVYYKMMPKNLKNKL
jgi:hypothetical protein